MAKVMRAGLIYRAKRGHVYDENSGRFNCYAPAEYADGCIFGDAWICDESGNIHPGYGRSPVPVRVDALGEVIGCIH